MSHLNLWYACYPPPFEIGNTKIIAMHIIYSRAFKSIMELIHLGDKRKCDACQALKVPDFRIHVFVQWQIYYFFSVPILLFSVVRWKLSRSQFSFGHCNDTMNHSLSLSLIAHFMTEWNLFVIPSKWIDCKLCFFFIYPNRNLFHGYESNTYINKHGINIIGKSVALKWSQIWPKVVSCWRKMGKSRQRKNCCWIFHLIKLTWISAGIWTDLLNGRQTLTWYT